MAETVIEVENVSKKYRLGTIGTGTLSSDLNRWWARMRSKEDPYAIVGQNAAGKHQNKDFWALKDINFEIKEGQAVGIIGKNGAGKSTLLKILSRVTTPTTGQIKVKGRIASLLEVGTGFHPELTGRENIFLNGAILGMTKWEIKSKLDEIISFSGVAQHIDTPVKRYSSGMYVRLAFAVAAHLDPEILIIDEVLAVGDAEFQKKCLGKMGEVAGQGRTVLFVSHNMTAVENLCRSGALFKNGKILQFGEIKSIVDSYLTTSSKYANFLEEASLRQGTGKLRISNIEFLDKTLKNSTSFKIGEELNIVIHYKCFSPPVNNVQFRITIYSDRGVPLANLGNYLSGKYIQEIKEDGKIVCQVKDINLNKGTYKLNVGIGAGFDSSLEVLDALEMASSFSVDGGDPLETGKLPDLGFIVIKPNWELV